jgi:hypothetical protein
MHYRDHPKSTRERIVAREVMKLELRQARQRSAGRAAERAAPIPATITPPSTNERPRR